MHRGPEVGEDLGLVFLQGATHPIEGGEQQNDPSQGVPRLRLRTTLHHLVRRIHRRDRKQHEARHAVLGANVSLPKVPKQKPRLAHASKVQRYTMERGLATLANSLAMFLASSMARCCVPSKLRPSMSSAFFKPIWFLDPFQRL